MKFPNPHPTSLFPITLLLKLCSCASARTLERRGLRLLISANDICALGGVVKTAAEVEHATPHPWQSIRQAQVFVMGAFAALLCCVCLGKEARSSTFALAPHPTSYSPYELDGSAAAGEMKVWWLLWPVLRIIQTKERREGGTSFFVCCPAPQSLTTRGLCVQTNFQSCARLCHNPQSLLHGLRGACAVTKTAAHPNCHQNTTPSCENHAYQQ